MGSACCKPKEPELTGLDAELEAQREAAARKKRILILGTGESGKSSLVKQVKQIFGVRPGKSCHDWGGQCSELFVPQTGAFKVRPPCPPPARAPTPCLRWCSQAGLSPSEIRQIAVVLRENVETCCVVSREPLLAVTQHQRATSGRWQSQA